MNIQQLLKTSQFPKPNVIFRYPKTQPKLDYVVDDKTNQFSDRIRSIHRNNKEEMSLTKVVSDIKVINEFSPIQYDLRASYSIMETSLINEFKLWEEMCDVDKSIMIKVEKGFHDIDTQIQSLAAQFDVCFTLQQKAEEKLLQFQKLVKGKMFTKFSRSNCRNSMPRNVYYCSYWDAICWKPPNERYPKQSQTISISQILQVHTNIQSYQKIRKNFKLPQWADKECFLAIEAQKDIFLELIAPDTQTRNLYVKEIREKVQEELVFNLKIYIADTNFLVTQYGSDVNNIRRTLDTTRQFFSINIEKLKNSFVNTTQTMLNEERLKSKKLKSKTMMIMEKNQSSVEDLIYENQNQMTQIKILEEELQTVQDRYYKSKTVDNNYEMSEIYRLSQEILALNGDFSIQNESSINTGVVMNPYQESLHNLERLKVHQDTSRNIELLLRQEIEDLQDNYQSKSAQERQIYNEMQLQRDDLLQANEELALKLDEFSSIIEVKENQFGLVLVDMREMQSTIQTLMMSTSSVVIDQYKSENAKLKTLLKKKLTQFKEQVVNEEKESSKLFSQFLSLLSCLIIPQYPNTSYESVIKQLCQVLPTLGTMNSSLSIMDQTDQERQLSEMVKSIENKVSYYLQSSDYKQNFVDSLTKGLKSLRQLGKKRCQSPQHKVVNNNVGLSFKTGSSTINSPSNSSWRDIHNKEIINQLNQSYY